MMRSIIENGLRTLLSDRSTHGILSTSQLPGPQNYSFTLSLSASGFLEPDLLFHFLGWITGSSFPQKQILFKKEAEVHLCYANSVKI